MSYPLDPSTAFTIVAAMFLLLHACHGPTGALTLAQISDLIHAHQSADAALAAARKAADTADASLKSALATSGPVYVTGPAGLVVWAPSKSAEQGFASFPAADASKVAAPGSTPPPAPKPAPAPTPAPAPATPVVPAPVVPAVAS